MTAGLLCVRVPCSVQLPLRVQALNTFIDDLFAFIIKMPTLHRVSCFRDDIVFVVFLYQRHIYKVDNTRVNEFGHTGETEADKDQKKELAGEGAAGGEHADKTEKKEGRAKESTESEKVAEAQAEDESKKEK